MCGRIFTGKWHSTSAHRSSKDPKCPIRSSNVKELISLQTKRAVANIKLDVVAAGKEAIAEAFSQIEENIVVFDAVTDDDIENIASALSLLFLLWGLFLVMQLWDLLLIWNVRRHLTHIKR